MFVCWCMRTGSILCSFFVCFYLFLLYCCLFFCLLLFFVLPLISTASWCVLCWFVGKLPFFTVRCSCLVSLLLLLLCVDGELVCAEGCTQVTGVMAMMMTGRVLLVCALCVLWCLTAFGDATDNRCIEGDGNVLTHTHDGGNDRVRLKADSGLIFTRMGLIKVAEAGEREEEDLEGVHASLGSVGGISPGSLLAGPGDNGTPGPKEVKGAAGAGLPPSMPGLGVSGTGDENSQSLKAGQEGNEQNSLEPKKKEPKESQDQATDQLPSSSGSTPTRSGEKSSLTGTDDLTPLPKGTETELSADPQDKNGSDEAIGEEDGEKEKEKNKKKQITTRETRGSE
ncbi:mucin-associated surface protein (MASP) [Trypanosoma cruzi Dm28c]|uniref:Mucin-associated surface protein (MASP) n=1 Tax=Trypanosoma cruzi Dm28c TaxID=1416333 RepID=V5BBF8_TRYCR|nr:mucin-associated surface protein (MASP) [Trypanosoma cruzi Dm28c]